MFVATLTGMFGAVEGTLTIDENDPRRSSAAASIDVRSIRTGIALRDAHLRSSQFFDVARHPAMTFISTHIEQVALSNWLVTGGLTIKETTKDVTLTTAFEGLPAQENGALAAKFLATVALDRRDFGLGRHGPGGIVGDQVTVRLQIFAIGKD